MVSRKSSGANEFRVIAGQYRRRKLTFAPESQARPTPNRVRETLFNWLEPHIKGLRVADLFAGSGALGIEALSRGAASAVFVERDARLARSLRDNLEVLGSQNGQVHCTTTEKWLEGKREAVDLVFLDPPFATRSHGKLCKLLERHRSIVPGGWCYLEMAADQEPDQLPQNWSVVRDKRAGNVRYQLVRVDHE
ncbi:MAG: 16S rRNA (guanine(966)-N(2))-methyltransferase RsmD [Gammaproteobacteria bacterium]